MSEQITVKAYTRKKAKAAVQDPLSAYFASTRAQIEARRVVLAPADPEPIQVLDFAPPEQDQDTAERRQSIIDWIMPWARRRG